MSLTKIIRKIAIISHLDVALILSFLSHLCIHLIMASQDFHLNACFLIEQSFLTFTIAAFFGGLHPTIPHVAMQLSKDIILNYNSV